MVVVLFNLAERLEELGVATSKSALQALIERAPKTATVRDAGGTKDVPVSEVAVGDTLVVKPADMIAVDAEVISGASSVDESAITGESLPQDKHSGDRVFAGTLNLQGYLEARVTKRAEESTLAKIVETTFAATPRKACGTDRPGCGDTAADVGQLHRMLRQILSGGR